jgi:hypothetical protein
MGVSGQHHAPVALCLGKGPPVPIVQEAGWASEPVWTQRLEEKFFASAGDRTPISRSSSPWSDTILTELPGGPYVLMHIYIHTHIYIYTHTYMYMPTVCLKMEAECRGRVVTTLAAYSRDPVQRPSMLTGNESQTGPLPLPSASFSVHRSLISYYTALCNLQNLQRCLIIYKQILAVLHTF